MEAELEQLRVQRESDSSLLASIVVQLAEMRAVFPLQVIPFAVCHGDDNGLDVFRLRHDHGNVSIISNRKYEPNSVDDDEYIAVKRVIPDTAPGESELSRICKCSCTYSVQINSARNTIMMENYMHKLYNAGVWCLLAVGNRIVVRVMIPPRDSSTLGLDDDVKMCYDRHLNALLSIDGHEVSTVMPSMRILSWHAEQCHRNAFYRGWIAYDQFRTFQNFGHLSRRGSRSEDAPPVEYCS